MGMSLVLLPLANQFFDETSFVMDMRSGCFLCADQRIEMTFIAVDMLLHSAEGFTCNAYAGKLQAPEDD